MKNKYVFVAVMLSALMAAGILFTSLSADSRPKGDGADSPDGTFRIVTSFYPVYIAALNIAGDCEGVYVQNMSGPQTGCLHDYQMTAEDMIKLSKADAFLINGGGMERFLAKAAAQYPKLPVINASEKVTLLDGNAHAWMSLADYQLQVQEIADGLSKLDVRHQEAYQQNCASYLKKIEGLCRKQQEVAKRLDGCNVMVFHEALEYVAKDYGLTAVGGMDLDEERQVSAKEAAELAWQVKSQDVELILAEEQYGKKMCEMVQAETGVRVAYLDTCVRGDDTADSYVNAMLDNIQRIQEALAPGQAAGGKR